MKQNPLSSDLSASSQISLAGIAKAEAAGFRATIGKRPDGDLGRRDRHRPKVLEWAGSAGFDGSLRASVRWRDQQHQDICAPTMNVNNVRG